MPFAVELFMDGAADAAVRAIWEALADAGLSPPSGEARPHVSLAACGDAAADRLLPLMEAFANTAPALPVTLASVGLFPTDEGVVFLAPVVTARLLDLHQRFHAALAQAGSQSWPYYVPGSWIPHCTLATTVPRDRLADALGACWAAPLPIQGQLTQIALVRFPPVQHIRTFDLAGA